MIKSAPNEAIWGDLLQIILMIIDRQQADCTNLGNELTIPCLSQQPHNAHALHITYPMAKLKMAYHIHVQRPIRGWSIYSLLQQPYIMWKMIFVMITGGECCNFHRVNSRVTWN